MANRDRQIRIYDLHSWSGIALGWLLYMVCFSGTIAVFAGDLTTWENPETRLTFTERPIAINETFTDWITTGKQEAGADARIGQLQFSYPSEVTPYYAASMTLHGESGDQISFEAIWDSNTGESLTPKGDGLSVWIRRFHDDFMWPDALGGRQIGLILVGLTGVVLILSLLSGVVAHTKIIQELFTLRYLKSVRLKWQDTHKVIGLWTLPFSIMIAVTGAFTGLVVALLPLSAIIIFEGDMQAMGEAFGLTPTQAAGEAAKMISLDEIARWHHEATGAAPQSVSLQNYGDEGATFQIFYAAPGELKELHSVSVNGATGDQVDGGVLDMNTAGATTLTAFRALHFGMFGGLLVKFLYFGLGSLLCLIIALGNMMWIERRRNGGEGRKSPRFYGMISRLNIGVSLGFPLATIGVFHADKLIFNGPENHVVGIGWIYFSFVAATLLYAIVRSNDYRATVELLGLAGLLAVLLPIVNWGLTGDVFVLDLFGATIAYAWVDGTFLITGVLGLITASKLPRKRPFEQRRIQTIDTASPERG